MIESGSTPDRSWLAGLICECPMGTALPTCPLAEIRKLPLAERFKTVKKMSSAEIASILTHHRRCLAERERERLTTPRCR